jgi:hypothetical protein
MTKTLHTTNGKPILVDDCDYEYLSRHKWRYVKTSNRTLTTIGDRTVQISQLILRPNPGEWIDHISGDAMDNRRCNLRICTPAENVANRRTQRNSKLGVKGVRQIPGGRYNARIYKSGRWYMLGTHDTLTDAARAYDAKAAELFGEFARLNNI